jgi:hypothetical protein
MVNVEIKKCRNAEIKKCENAKRLTTYDLQLTTKL